MQSRSLPARPNLDHLKHEAKTLLKTLRLATPDAKLAEAQRQLAREYGFATWAKLRDHVRALIRDAKPDIVGRVLRAVQAQELDAAFAMLEQHPGALSSLHVQAALGTARQVKALVDARPELVEEMAGDPPATPLLYACFTPRLREPDSHANQEQAVKALLEAGADPNAKDGRYGVPALYGVTGMHNAPRIARLLLEAGANPTDGESIFHAAERNNVEAMELLREFGVQLNHVGEWGNTALYFLLRWHDLDRDEPAAKGTEWLLAHGADPNVPSGKEQEDALQVAARRGQPARIVRLLLDHGANVDSRRGDGATPWILAKRYGRDGIARILEEAGAVARPLSPADELLAACGRGDVAAAKRLASRTLLASLASSDRALLNEAAAAGRTSVVAACIAAGFEVNDVNDRSATPLHEAAINGHSAVVRALLAGGARHDVKDPEHQSTPLGWAMFGADFVGNREGRYEETVRALLDAGATVRADEHTPRHEGVRKAIGL